MTFDVESAALEFAQELQDLLDGVLLVPTNVSMADRQVIAATVAGGRRYQVQVAAPKGLVVLTKNDQAIADLRITFQCTADTAGTYLAVERSAFELRVAGARLPVVRLDFMREAHTVPACHWNVHAESGAATRILTLGNPAHSGAFSKLHLPVGGARMRPCLEDFLAFVLHEFGVDRQPDAPHVLREGRERWRRRQIAALVRDAPDEAVRVLRDLGYAVADPTDGPVQAKAGKLQAW